MNNFFKKWFSLTSGLIGLIFSLVPDELFPSLYSIENSALSLFISKLTILIITWIVIGLILVFFSKIKWWVTIKGNDYKIVVKYANIFTQKDCKKLIHFDECFNTNLGDEIGDIRGSTVCGQYLTNNPSLDIIDLLNKNCISPLDCKSNFKNKCCYKLGTIIPDDKDYLLMAFGKLNSNGRAELSKEEYISCLNYMWENIDKYYNDKNVAVTVLGSNITRINGQILSQQELLEIIISTYKLSDFKLGRNHKIIICLKKDKTNSDFSLDLIGR